MCCRIDLATDCGSPIRPGPRSGSSRLRLFNRKQTSRIEYLAQNVIKLALYGGFSLEETVSNFWRLWSTNLSHKNISATKLANLTKVSKNTVRRHLVSGCRVCANDIRTFRRRLPGYSSSHRNHLTNTQFWWHGGGDASSCVSCADTLRRLRQKVRRWNRADGTYKRAVSQ